MTAYAVAAKKGLHSRGESVAGRRRLGNSANQKKNCREMLEHWTNLRVSRAGSRGYNEGVASDDLHSGDPCLNFSAEPTLDELIAQQGKSPILDAQSLHGNFWPVDEPIEEFLAALDEWRGRKRNLPAA
jgi:hypothetical protein